jgi:hypothetical protein
VANRMRARLRLFRLRTRRTPWGSYFDALGLGVAWYGLLWLLAHCYYP